jgi:hypothetical protein
MSGSNGDTTQSSKGERHSQDTAVINELLNDLPINDRQAILRFYVYGQPQEEIVSALGLDGEYFRGLRQSFKAAFFARTGRGC